MAGSLFLEVRHFQHPIPPGPESVAGHPVKATEERDVLVDGQIRIEGEFL
jgi:hypothetical protein